MKSARMALSKAYKELLIDLTYNDNRVALFDRMATSKAASPYVILGPWTPNSDNDKDVFVEKGSILLDVVQRFEGGNFSIGPTSTIAESITELLQPSPGAEVLHLEGFSCTNTVIVNVREITAATLTGTLHRTLITVQHSLEALDE